jgi:ADP-ribosylglycohydrolase
MLATHEECLARAYCSLEGLSVGDAFGETFFVLSVDADELIEKEKQATSQVELTDDANKLDSFISNLRDLGEIEEERLAVKLIKSRVLEPSLWDFTDDTNMALSIISCLRQFGAIDQEWLARSYAERYDVLRGYGMAMHRALERIRNGEPWPKVAGELFVGQGSFGNGGAMRVAPLGAYFADDLDRVVEQARRSAEITHAHPEGSAGAIAVAVAAAWAWRMRESGTLPEAAEFLDKVLPFVPDSEVRERIRHARKLASGSSVQLAVAALGNGSKVTAQDTVPFALWCATQQLNNFEEALWLTVSGLGDRDTTCAIVGGIVALYTGIEGIPAVWRKNREPLPDWAFKEVLAS